MKFSPEAVERCKGAFPDLDVDTVVQRMEARLSLPGSKEINQPDAYLWSACERNQDEGKFRKGAGGGRVAHDELPHRGFDVQGCVIRSSIPISNGPTHFARFLVREIREQLLTPADVVLLLLQHDKASQNMFRPSVVAHWSYLDSIDHWGCGSAHSSFEEYVRSWGGSYPWTRDPLLWSDIRQTWTARKSSATEDYDALPTPVLDTF